MFDTLFEEREKREKLVEERTKEIEKIKEEDLVDKLEYVLECLSLTPTFTTDKLNYIVLENYKFTTAYATDPRNTDRIMLYIENITTKQERAVFLTQSPNDVRVTVTNALFELK